MKRFLLTVLNFVTKPFRAKGLTKFYPFLVARSIYKAFYQRLTPRVLTVHGSQIFLDSIDGNNLVLHGDQYEKETVRVFHDEIKLGDTVLDVGAHIGYFTLLAARLVGPQGRVWAFEANPESFALLAKSVKANNYSNVTLTQKVVFDTTKRGVKFFLADSTSSLYNKTGRKSILTESIALDDFFKSGDAKVDFIKMDIEGAEPMALRGMVRLLEKNKHVKLVTEFSYSLLKLSGIEPADFLNMLSGLGFTLYKINEIGGGLEKIDDVKGFAQKEKGTNILCKRNS